VSKAAVDHPVAHADDLAPRNAGFGVAEIDRDAVGCCADLRQPHADGVEDDRLVATVLLELSDCRDRGPDVVDPVLG